MAISSTLHTDQLTPRATEVAEGNVTTMEPPVARSLSFSGRTRHTTFTRHDSLDMSPLRERDRVGSWLI